MTEEPALEAPPERLQLPPSKNPPPASPNPTTLSAGAHLAAARLRTQLGNWRLFLVRCLSSGLAVTVTVLVLPGLWFEYWHWGEFLIIAFAAGILNATVKPFLQFFSLRYLIASYGIAVLLVNSAILWLMSLVLGGEIEIRGLVALLFGGLVVGLLGMFFDAILGTGPPILDSTDQTAWSDSDPAGTAVDGEGKP